jgi:hypothetical protein
MNIRPGTKVRIIEDCRTGHNATGQIGIYEGDFPRTVSLLYLGKWYEYMYNAFVNGEIKFTDGRSVIDLVKRDEDLPGAPVFNTFEQDKQWYAESSQNRWFVNYNPLICLPDGSYIWGDECWWEEFETQDHTLPEAQESLEQQKEFLRVLFSEEATNAT